VLPVVAGVFVGVAVGVALELKVDVALCAAAGVLVRPTVGVVAGARVGVAVGICASVRVGVAVDSIPTNDTMLFAGRVYENIPLDTATADCCASERVDDVIHGTAAEACAPVTLNVCVDAEPVLFTATTTQLCEAGSTKALTNRLVEFVTSIR
jgi:hypothetical protein